MKYVKYGIAAVAAQNINCCCCCKCSKNNDEGQEHQQTEEERIKELEEKINNEWKDNFTLNAATITNINVISKFDENINPIDLSEEEKKKMEEITNRVDEEYKKKFTKNNNLYLYMCKTIDFKNKSIYSSFIISEKIEVKETLEECNKAPIELMEDIKNRKIKDEKIDKLFMFKQLEPNFDIMESRYIKKGTFTTTDPATP